MIAKAKAERERKEVEAEQDKLANDKRVAADLEIAQKQNELKLKQAALKQEADIAPAKADAAKGIEAEVQRREQERVAAGSQHHETRERSGSQGTRSLGS